MYYKYQYIWTSYGQTEHGVIQKSPSKSRGDVKQHDSRILDDKTKQSFIKLKYLDPNFDKIH